eukprot:gnl/TRDRNA2_/TRDRNA2_174909_c1_seq2.p1 gnl/TRDRNA2_/TRDRNA2_174909_c1~~gnl/TRDRNA2_/TRDRNA2_174909_c1_seq2.p1  ORF type:complete len:417 (+),score=42.57 gnl/TRDRNA2_/TRDRNA2_174909_c1_seq2:221-1471(+)
MCVQDKKILTLDPSRVPPTVYTTVLHNSRHAADTASWMRVTLADGSSVCMTADHPVWPECGNGQMEQRIGAVKASDLLPGVDALWVFGPHLVTVSSADRVPIGEAPGDRMCLELERVQGGGDPQVLLALQQEETDVDEKRHAQGASTFIAVGDAPTKSAYSRLDAFLSASSVACSEKFPGGMHLVQKEGMEGENMMPLRRSYSDPSLMQATAEENASSINSLHSSRPPQSVMHSKNTSSSSSIPGSKGSWTNTTSESSMSKSSGPILADVVVGGPQHSAAYGCGGVLLSDFLALPKDSTGQRVSYGTLPHVQGDDPTCKPCVFIRKGTCRFGPLCHYCHAAHAPYRKTYRKRSNGVKYPRPTSHYHAASYLDVARENELDNEVMDMEMGIAEASSASAMQQTIDAGTAMDTDTCCI